MWDRRLAVSGMSLPERIRYHVADFLFPPLCAGCGERGTWLCGRCFGTVPALESLPGLCRRCGLPVVSGRCGCSALHPKVAKAISGWPYGGWVAKAVIGAKYEGEKDRAQFLGAVLVMSEASTVLEQADYVVPVPMFEKKRLERGYNQAALMADAACRLLGRSAPTLLVRQHEERPSQVGLSARARRENVRGSFSLAPGFAIPPGARIALVDDVRTTGATVAACVDAIRQLRPRRIDVVTLAAELPRNVMEELDLPM